MVFPRAHAVFLILGGVLLQVAPGPSPVIRRPISILCHTVTDSRWTFVASGVPDSGELGHPPRNFWLTPSLRGSIAGLLQDMGRLRAYSCFAILIFCHLSRTMFSDE